MTLTQIKVKCHDHYLAIRSYKRIIDSREFEIVFPYLSDTERQSVEQYTLDLNKRELIKLIKKHLIKNNCLGELSVTDLRKIAIELGIRGANYIPKASLLSEIVLHASSTGENRISA